ncbi:MAG: hypothetical protein H6867_06415 [Rhodospirillales bacterium]|nr:hypothetical protein [Rhodospirillales bacterium]MCB9995182.1 hypothetical protein [Rhodospirillales bacterium]
MADTFIDIDFYHGLPSHSFVDKKTEVRINLGRLSSVPKDYESYRNKYGDILLGIQQSGMTADKLDQMCHLLALNCKSLGIELLVTKSNRHFDSQWYFFGDIQSLLRAASDDLVRPPFTSAVHDQINQAMNILLR